MHRRHSAYFGVNEKTDHSTSAQRFSGAWALRILDEATDAAFAYAREPVTSPLSCAWLVVVLVSLAFTVVGSLSLCYWCRKSPPEWETIAKVKFGEDPSDHHQNHSDLVIAPTTPRSSDYGGTRTAGSGDEKEALDWSRRLRSSHRAVGLEVNGVQQTPWETFITNFTARASPLQV
ncbi:uncharacterized protein LOC8030700 isoform X2 [Ixodes scapularis]|uniref:uncharacterized protein LOC8030700 isoform X2 n=1 Tax=Ixodes scapularis TaxID=6945 RepID=UPI001C38E502|nr:uncharacterized protein LOC8030700 isoform X2 [Ixodes scapularis]